MAGTSPAMPKWEPPRLLPIFMQADRERSSVMWIVKVGANNRRANAARLRTKSIGRQAKERATTMQPKDADVLAFPGQLRCCRDALMQKTH